MTELEYKIPDWTVTVTQSVERAILLEMLAKRISVKWASSEVFGRAKFVEVSPARISVRLWGRCVGTEMMRDDLHLEWLVQLNDDFESARQRADAEYRNEMRAPRAGIR